MSLARARIRTQDALKMPQGKPPCQTTPSIATPTKSRARGRPSRIGRPRGRLGPQWAHSNQRKTQKILATRSMIRALLPEPIASSGNTRRTINQSRRWILLDLMNLSPYKMARRSQYKGPPMQPQTVSHTLIDLTIHSQIIY